MQTVCPHSAFLVLQQTTVMRERVVQRDRLKDRDAAPVGTCVVAYAAVRAEHVFSPCEQPSCRVQVRFVARAFRQKQQRRDRVGAPSVDAAAGGAEQSAVPGRIVRRADLVRDQCVAPLPQQRKNRLFRVRSFQDHAVTSRRSALIISRSGGVDKRLSHTHRRKTRRARLIDKKGKYDIIK